jgi:hypothetical protein
MKTWGDLERSRAFDHEYLPLRSRFCWIFSYYMVKTKLWILSVEDRIKNEDSFAW